MVPNKNKHQEHGRTEFMNQEGARKKLAHHLVKREIASLHWDNCKVEFNYGIAYSYVREAIQRGWEKGSIVRAYRLALEDCHARATDQALMTGSGRIMWVNSSTVSKARDILRRIGCRYSGAETMPRAYAC